MCNASKTGSSDRRAARSSPASVDNRGSAAGEVSSWLELGEPERSQRRLRLQVGERHLERRRAGDQDHVISYSHEAQRRIRSEQSGPGHLPKPPAGAVALDRALDAPADGHSHPAFGRRARDRESDQGTSAVEALAADRRLEIGAPTKAETTFDLGQPLPALTTPVAQYADAASGAHPAEEPMHAAAVSLLGLVGAFDRASVPEARRATGDTRPITSSRARRALRYPQAGDIVPARKQRDNARSPDPVQIAPSL